MRCEGNPRFRSVLRVAVGTHWSEDTLGLPRMNLARCVLPPSSPERMCGVNFPLFTYSVLAKENVSRGNQNIFEVQQESVCCPQMRTSDRARPT